jgi:hypothetical protein|tara:strand:- start:3922 stop:4599 length:678 start_codon:yes stop_codon:yes gene_type:complete
MKDKYYVYKVTLEGRVVYVGKGSGTRINHVSSGCSHNSKINEAYFRSKLLGEPPLKVEIITYLETSKEALAEESRLIKELDPDYNTFRCSDSEALSVNKNITSYESFVEYIQECYKAYLESTTSSNPHNLKWYVYSKLNSTVWEGYSNFLQNYYSELRNSTKDSRVNNKGRPRKSFPDKLGMNSSERTAFYYYQRKMGEKFSMSSDKDIDEVVAWLDNRRKSSPN